MQSMIVQCRDAVSVTVLTEQSMQTKCGLMLLANTCVVVAAVHLY